MGNSAYLLVSHGSRDPRPQIAVKHLGDKVYRHLQEKIAVNDRSDIVDISATPVLIQNSSPLIATASLELSSVSLQEKIIDIALQAKSVGLDSLQIIPLFLLPGVHVQEDIPREVALAQQQLPQTIKIQLQSYLGSHQQLSQIIARQFEQLSTSGRILLGHGSRRLGGNKTIEAIASQVSALSAYWSQHPSLETQVAKLVQEGHQSIAIVPYFLFSGGITDGIAEKISQLQTTYPQLQLILGQPLGNTTELTNLIIDLLN